MKRTEQQNLEFAFKNAAPTIQKVGWHCGFVSIPKVVSVFSFSDFKAKAFRFCLFFCPNVIVQAHDKSGSATEPSKFGSAAHDWFAKARTSSRAVISCTSLRGAQRRSNPLQVIDCFTHKGVAMTLKGTIAMTTQGATMTKIAYYPGFRD